MSYKIQTKILSKCEEHEKEEIRGSFVASYAYHKKLLEVLEDKLASVENESLSKDLYENPNWAFRQADIAGYKRAIKEIKNFL
ncbi:hypothetical protein [Salinivibrio phage CW02]|uniref:Uncharacterized protein n=1 Tax=Salinivibrio phage CW02 TaxID=1161935 RepID=H9D1H4_9CAUD|nr:hypothetical protein F490_gp21 [Salinivibrio phage CW02]AFE86216.1 hypothetical protein [Salinivibrio phage CW02]